MIQLDWFGYATLALGFAPVVLCFSVCVWSIRDDRRRYGR